MIGRFLKIIVLAFLAALPNFAEVQSAETATIKTDLWTQIDHFENTASINQWIRIDPDNQTEPYVANPQVTEIRLEPDSSNHYLLKKPAANGVIGNRKALSFKALPMPMRVGKTYTLYTRFYVEEFPNNHAFGLSNLSAAQIAQQNYNAFEPMIRITDKYESDGFKNDGTLMVLSGYKVYSKIFNPKTGKDAQPLKTNHWYELWCVVNNKSEEAGGQSYDVYMRGGEFAAQEKVLSGAVFRIKREKELSHFITISNTGSVKKPYGNGGVRYDDIYMATGLVLSVPSGE